MLFSIAAVLELLLITSVANATQGVGSEFGPWGIHMSSGLSSVVSWVVTVLAAIAFVMFFAGLQFGGMIAVMGLVVLVELLWGRALPTPQNRWDLALAFVAGAFAMFLVALSRTEFIENARTRLGAIWHTGHTT
jgi:hypothetical protein